MANTEFLEQTSRRNIKFLLGKQVQRRLAEYAQDLEHRRRKLAAQLENENRMLEEELMELERVRDEKAEESRREWILLTLMKSEQLEQEFNERRVQLEIESSEEYRHMETKQLLLDSKEAQLMQIEERRARRRKS